MNESNKLISKNPLLTIVTVVLNKEEVIENTLLSVINQSYFNIEYIVIDGGSKDGTMEVINKYKENINHIISEKDGGIYDAMNKGINLAKGSWINFMNAGDRFTNNDVISKLPFSSCDINPILYGNRSHNGSIIYPNSCRSLKFGEIMACHQSMFFNINPIFKKSVLYDTKFLIYADYELVNRLYLEYGNFKYYNESIVISEGNGISSTVSMQKRNDKYKILFSHYGFKGIYRGIMFRIFNKTNKLKNIN
jgi:glycosyltransferase involved in cell wall biosynthesis